MRISRLVFALLSFVTLVGCEAGDKSKEKHSAKNGQVVKINSGADSSYVRFASIKQVYEDGNGTKWTDKGSFWWLYFASGKVFFDFNPSCGYWFPAELKSDKIIFYWARNRDCTFDRGLNATFKGVESPESGKAFGEICLINDTTIRINYFYKDWVKRVNEAERESIDTLFPVQLFVMKL